MRIHYTTLYEDADIVCVDKPANLLSIADRFDTNKPNLRSMLKRRYGAAYVVHRLDAETSGVIVYALNAETHAAMSQLFENRDAVKKYLILCQSPQDDQGFIDAPIREHTGVPGRYVVHAKGKESQTSYKVLERFGGYALVEIDLHTGRTHQIRVHMRHIGAPLLVDAKYGVSEAFFLSAIKHVKIGKFEEEKPLLARASLHASSLDFIHPITAQAMHFEAELPKDMKATIHQLKKIYHK